MFEPGGHDMTETTRRGRGGKLVRSEVVQVRLDPKLRFAAELAAAKERRTLSSFIEWAVERTVREVVVHYEPNEGQHLAEMMVANNTWAEAVRERLSRPREHSAELVANNVWDVDEADRFINLANHYPGLLTHDEQRRWKFIQETRVFWLRDENDGFLRPNLPAIRAAWGLIEQHIAEREPFDWNLFANNVEERGIAVEYEEPKLPTYLFKETIPKEPT